MLNWGKWDLENLGTRAIAQLSESVVVHEFKNSSYSWISVRMLNLYSSTQTLSINSIGSMVVKKLIAPNTDVEMYLATPILQNMEVE